MGQINYSFHFFKDVKVHDGIKAFVESRDSDMIAFINRKHHFFKTIFRKPLVKELGYYSDLPVLELNDRS